MIELKCGGVTLAEWLYYEVDEDYTDATGEIVRISEEVYPTGEDIERFVAERLAEMFRKVLGDTSNS